MTTATIEDRYQEAARSVAGKFQAFNDSLTEDEQLALDLALRQFSDPNAEPLDDVEGHVVKMNGLSSQDCFAQAALYLRLWNAGTAGLGSRLVIECTYPSNSGGRA